MFFFNVPDIHSTFLSTAAQFTFFTSNYVLRKISKVRLVIVFSQNPIFFELTVNLFCSIFVSVIAEY